MGLGVETPFLQVTGAAAAAAAAATGAFGTRRRGGGGVGRAAGGRRVVVDVVVVKRQRNVPDGRAGLYVAQPHSHVLERAGALDAVERVAAGRQRNEGVVARQRRRVREDVGRDGGALGPEAGDAAQQQCDGRDDEQR